MLDHAFLSVSDLDRSIAWFAAALAPLSITTRVGYDGMYGPRGHPDLKDFGAGGRIFWLRHDTVDSRAADVDSIAPVEDAVQPGRRITTLRHQEFGMSVRTAMISARR